MLVASTSVVGFGFRSGKLRTSKCLPICPRKRTYLPILERLPTPALRECRHRGLARRLVAVGWPAVRVLAKTSATPWLASTGFGE